MTKKIQIIANKIKPGTVMKIKSLPKGESVVLANGHHRMRAMFSLGMPIDDILVEVVK